MDSTCYDTGFALGELNPGDIYATRINNKLFWCLVVKTHDMIELYEMTNGYIFLANHSGFLYQEHSSLYRNGKCIFGVDVR